MIQRAYFFKIVVAVVLRQLGLAGNHGRSIADHRRRFSVVSEYQLRDRLQKIARFVRFYLLRPNSPGCERHA